MLWLLFHSLFYINDHIYIAAVAAVRIGRIRHGCFFIQSNNTMDKNSRFYIIP